MENKLNVIITKKDMELKGEFEKHVLDKVNKRLSRYNLENIEVNVKFSKEKNNVKAEISFPYIIYTVRGEKIGNDEYAALDYTLDVIEGQMRKAKTRIESKRRKPEVEANYADYDEEENINIVREKVFYVKPMCVEEAIEQMITLNHDFFLFYNMDTDSNELVYKRKDGGYGHITCTLS